MKNNKNKQFFYEQKPLKKWLFEQEDVFDAEEEDTPEETEDEDAAPDAEASDEPADTEVEADEEDEEEEVVVDPSDEVKLSKSVDQDLEALLMDYEMQARKSKEIEVQNDEEGIQIESLSLKFLTEDVPPAYEDDLDLDRFSAEVARLVKNYTSLLDMEKMLVNKAREFVITRYGEKAEKDLINILADKHDIEVVSPDKPPTSALNTPAAVGAGTGGSGGSA